MYAVKVTYTNGIEEIRNCSTFNLAYKYTDVVIFNHSRLGLIASKISICDENGNVLWRMKEK